MGKMKTYINTCLCCVNSRGWQQSEQGVELHSISVLYVKQIMNRRVRNLKNCSVLLSVIAALRAWNNAPLLGQLNRSDLFVSRLKQITRSFIYTGTPYWWEPIRINSALPTQPLMTWETNSDRNYHNENYFGYWSKWFSSKLYIFRGTSNFSLSSN